MRLTPEKKELTVNIIASLFIFLFVYTAFSKLSNVEGFKSTLLAAKIPKTLAGFISITVPVSEIAISLMLLLPSWRKTGFMFSIILMGIFTIYIAYMLLFISDLPCSCGGIIQRMNWGQHFIFNIILFLLSFLGWKMKQDSSEFLIAISRRSRKPV